MVQRVQRRNDASLMRSSTCFDSEVPITPSTTTVTASSGSTLAPLAERMLPK